MEQERKARLEWQKSQAGSAKAQTFAMNVAASLGVISALVASALMAALLSPPDAVYNPDTWGGTPARQAACYSELGSGLSDLTTCTRWQRVYGFSALLAFVLDMAALLLTVSVAMGITGGLVLALAFFVLGVWGSAVTVMAGFWLSASSLVAIFSTVCLSMFLLASLLLLLPAVVWVVINARIYFGGPLTLNSSGGANPRWKQRTGVIHWAAAGSNSTFFRFFTDLLLRLLANTEDLDQHCPEGVTPLYLAAWRGRTTAVRILLEAGADPDHTINFTSPLYVAAAVGAYDVCELLLMALADPNKCDHYGRSPLDMAKTIKVGRLLKLYGAKFNHLDSVDNFIKKAEELRKADLRKNKQQLTPVDEQVRLMYLYRAAHLGHVAAVKELLGNVTDPNQANTLDEGGGEDGNTPLGQAAAAGELEAVQAFRACSRVDCMVKNVKGRTPYQIARTNGSLEVAEELIDWERAVMSSP